MEYWSADTKRYILTLSLVAIAGLVYLARSVLPLILWAALFAFVLHPVVSLLHRLRIPRTLAVVIVYALFLTFLIAIPLIVIPLTVQQVLSIQVDPQELGMQLYDWAWRTAQTYQKGRILGFSYDVSSYLDTWLAWLWSGRWLSAVPSTGEIVTAVQRALTTATGLVLGATGVAGTVALHVITGIFAFFMTLIYTLYLLIVAPRLRVAIYELFPEGYHREISYLIYRIVSTWRRYLRGQLLLCFTIFALSLIGLTIIGMPSAFVLALVAGFLELIPNLGPILATIPAVVVALIQGSGRWAIPHWQFALITIGLYTIIQQLENQLLVPRIVGDAVNVHPFLILIAIIVGTEAGGILGALLAAPTLATLRILAEYIHARLLDRPPFPELAAAEAEAAVVAVPPPESAVPRNRCRGSPACA